MPLKKYYKPRPTRVVLCACGCGEEVTGTKRRKYVDDTHRKRAHRRRTRANKLADWAYLTGQNQRGMKPDA